MNWKVLGTFALLSVLLVGLACSGQRAGQNGTYKDNGSYKDNVKQALQQAELKDVTVDEDRDHNTITLAGKVHSEKAQAPGDGSC
jgi:hypothetical protein